MRSARRRSRSNERLPESLDLEHVAVGIAHERVVDPVGRILGRLLDELDTLGLEVRAPAVDLVGDEREHHALRLRRRIRALAEAHVGASAYVVDAAGTLVARQTEPEDSLVEVGGTPEGARVEQRDLL